MVESETPTSTPRVFLVDDHAMFRAGVRAELGNYVDLVGEAGTVAEAIATIQSVKPDVVLLDVHMPDGGGRAVLEAVRKADASIRFLALSVSDAAEDVIGLVRAGARGYVTKTISAAELADAIRRVADGDAVFFPHAWPDSCWTPSLRTRPRRFGIPTWTSSPTANARCCGF